MKTIDKNKHENLKVLLKSFPEIPSTCEESALAQQDARNFIKVHQYEFIALSNQMWDKLMEHVQDKRNKQLTKLCTELEGLFKTELVGMCLRLSLGME